VLPGDLILRRNKVFRTLPSNAGLLLHEAGWSLVGLSGVVEHFRVSCPMTIWRWAKSGMPCYKVAGRLIFDLFQVGDWLERKGYDIDRLAAGKGTRKSRVKTGEHRWKKGRMSQAPAGKRSRRRRK